MNDLEENCVVFYVSDTTIEMTAPATKPADWDTKYAKANSGYGIWNATTGEYRRATGFEAVLGYLYLTKQYNRIIDLIKIGLEAINDGK